MRLSFLIPLAAALLAPVFGAPLEERSALEERSTTRVYGNKVAVVSGIIITNHLTQCFQNSGVEIAKAYAAAIADQWDAHQNAHGGTGWIVSAEGQWASSNTQNLFCSTFDAVFTFGTSYSANQFAGWVRNLMGNTKRDTLNGFSLGDLRPDVYVAGIDLPADHPYFGKAVTASGGEVLSKRNWKSCSNSKCGFSFSSDQTGICRDKSFPKGNHFYC